MLGADQVNLRLQSPVQQTAKPGTFVETFGTVLENMLKFAADSAQVC